MTAPDYYEETPVNESKTNPQPGDAVTIIEPDGFLMSSETTDVVERLTKTQIVTTAGRRFDRTSLRERGGNPLWNRRAKIKETPDDHT